jgi:hypothetical protein
MRRRHLLQAFAFPMAAGGCATGMAPSPRADQPPAGAVTANAAYPPIGAKWAVRITERRLLQSSTEDRGITAAAVAFDGQRGYGLVSARLTCVLDPSTFNPIGTLVDGNVAITERPYAALFSWPLWVGKTWRATCYRADRVYGGAWPAAQSDTRVAAFENVVVPAGRFDAFRIEFVGGIGSDAQSTPQAPGLPGFGTRETHWYAPGPKLIVKSEITRASTSYLWGGRTSAALISAPT